LKNADIASGAVLRELSVEARHKIIDMCIDDVAFRALLKVMLEDCPQRPDASMLLDHPILKFFKLVVPQSYAAA
jgi:hypothetical protein